MGSHHIPKYRGQNRGYVALQAEADLKAAEARADESQRLADSLLAQHYEEWVPHWVADGFERVRLSWGLGFRVGSRTGG